MAKIMGVCYREILRGSLGLPRYVLFLEASGEEVFGDLRGSGSQCSTKQMMIRSSQFALLISKQ